MKKSTLAIVLALLCVVIQFIVGDENEIYFAASMAMWANFMSAHLILSHFEKKIIP